MPQIKYEPLSKLMISFKEVEEELRDDFQSSDISWGSEKQLTLADSGYIHDIVDEFLSQELDDARDQNNAGRVELFERLLQTLQRARSSSAMNYCMEE